MSVYLQNSNLRIRALEPEDLDFLYRCENDAENWNTGTVCMPLSRYVLRQYIEQMAVDIYATNQLKWMITLLDGTCVGTLELNQIDHFHGRAEVGVFIEKSYRQQGYALQALQLLAVYAQQKMGWHQLTAMVAKSNAASHQLFQRVGFVQCGMYADYLKTEQGFEDVVLYQLVL